MTWLRGLPKSARFVIFNSVCVIAMAASGELHTDAVSIGLAIFVLSVMNVVIVIGERRKRE